MSGERQERRLERRCRRLVRAYPDGGRGDEVLTTLLDGNAGRAAPRAGDALNVLWHGLAARLGSRSAGTRFGGLGDAVAVAVVTLQVMQTATALAVTLRLYGPLAIVARGTVLVAAAMTVAMCLGRVRTARVLLVVAALAGAVTLRVGWWPYPPERFASVWAVAVAVLGVATALVVLFTGTIARAARVVPAWWWGMAALVCSYVAFGIAGADHGPHSTGRFGVVLMTYCVQPLVLMLLGLPLLRMLPRLSAGLALLVAAGVPFLAYGWYDANVTAPLAMVVLAVTGVAWLVLGAVVVVTVRLAPKTY
jgi:hypothetical protein